VSVTDKGPAATIGLYTAAEMAAQLRAAARKLLGG
jgi:hypothetical protein